MNIPKISIIVPIYNTAWNLKKNIQSLLNQTYTNFEIVLINDGSTDESLDICQYFASIDNRIILINKENTGVSDSRNIGIKCATGEYITFVDSDDWVDETYLEDFHAEALDDEDEFVVQGIKYYFPDKYLQRYMFKYPSISLLKLNAKKIIDYDILSNGCPVAKLFSRRVIVENEVFFNTEISLNEDHLFVLDYYLCIDSVRLCNTVNYNYYYNYKLPSLTKKYHPSYEYINISTNINASYVKLINKFGNGLLLYDKYYTMFGPLQLIKASYSSFIEKESYNKFTDIISLWRENNIDIKRLNVCGLYSLFFVNLFNYMPLKLFYICLNCAYVCEKNKRMIIDGIKNLIYRTKL